LSVAVQKHVRVGRKLFFCDESVSRRGNNPGAKSLEK
jgi:hypothetical protein